MKTNILNLKLHKQYKRCIHSICLKNSNLEKKGIDFIDDFLLYLHQCHYSINEKVNNTISNKPHKNTYQRNFDEFNFYITINKDLSCEIGVDLVMKSHKKINDTLLKSVYMNTNGYVYFLESEYGFKIGCTKDINRRFKELKTQMPFELKLNSFIKISNYSNLEKLLHNTFEDKRLNGEWFNLDESDFTVIDEIAKLHKTKRLFNK